MSQSYQIILWEIMEITPEQAARLLDSGVGLWKTERKYLQAKIEGMPFNKMRFPRYMTNEMAIIRASVTKRKTKDWAKWQIGGE